jgi:hypothetical protein
MAQKFEEYMCNYLVTKSELYKKYLTTALDSKNQSVCYLDESLGTSVPSADIRMCELLADSQLFQEEIKLTRDGRNRYKLFFLTELGKEMAQQIKEEQ